eukprot:1161653-Pelagomonas_calceolata.AAC.14
MKAAWRKAVAVARKAAMMEGSSDNVGDRQDSFAGGGVHGGGLRTTVYDQLACGLQRTLRRVNLFFLKAEWGKFPCVVDAQMLRILIVGLCGWCMVA